MVADSRAGSAAIGASSRWVRRGCPNSAAAGGLADPWHGEARRPSPAISSSRPPEPPVGMTECATWAAMPRRRVECPS